LICFMMKRRLCMNKKLLQNIALIVTCTFFLQSCLPWLNKYEQKFEAYRIRNFSDKEAKQNLRGTLEKMAPGNATARREVSFYLHSLKRIAAGKIDTKYEISMAKVWEKLDPKDREFLLKRISYLDSMPIYLQKKIVDDSYIYAKLGPLPFPDPLHVESAGTVCGPTDTEICRGALIYGNIEMPEGSQGLVLDPSRPLAAVAAGQAGLLLINVSNLSNPTYFPSSPFSSSNTGFVNDLAVKVDGNNTYMLITSSATANKTGAFEVVEITDPFSVLSVVGKISGSYHKIAVSDDAAWAFSNNLENNTIEIISLSVLSAPQVVNSVSAVGSISDLSFSNGTLHVLTTDGSSLFYSFGMSSTTPVVPELTWSYGPNGLACAGGEPDVQTEILPGDNRSTIVRDACVDIVALTAYGASDTGIFVSTPRRHNSGAFIDDGSLVVDSVLESEIRDTGSDTTPCDLPGLTFYKIPENGPTEPVQFHQINLPNEVKGIAVRNETIYVADHISTFHCKGAGESTKFRIFALPESIQAYQDITPTIDTINGADMFTLNELPNSVCGSQAVFCTSSAQCGPTGYCVGGICTDPPVIDVSDNQMIVLTGTNYWDINAQVLIQNMGSSSWIPFDATVQGDEYCELMDQMTTTLNASVTASGLKKVKIRNYNTDPKLHTCVDCENLDNPSCNPDYVDSEEVIVYFRNTRDSSETGYDLRITKIMAKQGSNGWMDLGPNAWYDDETALIIPDPGDGSATFWIPDEDGFEFQHNGEYEDLSSLIAFKGTNDDDGITSPSIQLWESDDARALGGILLASGLTCAGTVYKTQVCGPYVGGCIAVCLTIAAVGLLMVIFDGGDFIAMEPDNGLNLTKEVARKVIQFGGCALPDSWESDSSASTNKVLSVSGVTQVGGIKQRYIIKQYVCKECSKSEKNGEEWGGKYWIWYRLSERN
jgi:hypothetical protein